MMAKHTILIAGGSGLIGQRLTDRFIEQGFSVHILSRTERFDSRPMVKYFKWDIGNSTLDDHAWDGVTDLVQLTGAPITDHKWTEEYKQVLIDSRVDSSALLEQSMTEHNIRLNHIYAASAIGYFGDRPSTEVLTEFSKPGTSFIANLVQEWERAGSRLSRFAEQHTLMRIGLVLDKKEGFLSKFIPGLKLLTAPYFGSGDQYYSWIHIEDLVHYVIWSIDKELAPVTNLVAPEALSSKAFSKILADVSSLPAVAIPVPKLAIKLAYGQRSEVILMSSNVRPAELLKQGYPYKFDELRSALEDLL